MKKNGMGKTISLAVKIYAVLFGSVCYCLYFLINKKLPDSSMTSGIVFMMLAFQSVVLSVDTSMVINNLKKTKENMEYFKNDDTKNSHE